MADMLKEMLKAIEDGDKRVRDWLAKNAGWKEEPWPKIPRKEQVKGEAYVKAHPILGIEKYLGMSDSEKRIGWFPSIKLTNDSFTTKTYAKFDPSLRQDIVVFGSALAQGKEMKRIMHILDEFRSMAGIKTKCVIVSRHIPKVEAKAKGLGLSAAAGGAVGKALIEAALPELSGNKRFLNVVARHLSGSATSSAAGGFSVWFSHKGMASEDSYAVRVDKGDVDVKLVVVPIPKSIKTEDAHGSAEKSELYEFWALNKPDKVIALMEAIKQKDVAKIGRIAELDSLNLFHLLVSGNGFFNWNDFTLALLTKVTQLRKKKGMVAYCSMDTGPSVAIITTGKDADAVKVEIERFVRNSGMDYPVYIAEMAGPPEKLPLERKGEIVTEEVRKLLSAKGIVIK